MADEPQIDPELERRSRRNKIAVTIGFFVLLIGTLIMARILTNIVKAPVSEPAPVEAPAPDEPSEE